VSKYPQFFNVDGVPVRIELEKDEVASYVGWGDTHRTLVWARHSLRVKKSP